MLRHYYVSDDLDELEIVERELEAEGFTEPQIHVLSLDDCHVEQHHLHEVESLLKQDAMLPFLTVFNEAFTFENLSLNE